jgi:hypothetical protein
VWLTLQCLSISGSPWYTHRVLEWQD